MRLCGYVLPDVATRQFLGIKYQMTGASRVLRVTRIVYSALVGAGKKNRKNFD